MELLILKCYSITEGIVVLILFDWGLAVFCMMHMGSVFPDVVVEFLLSTSGYAASTLPLDEWMNEWMNEANYQDDALWPSLAPIITLMWSEASAELK